MKIVIFQKKMSPLPFIQPLKKNGKFTKILLEHNANPNLVNKSYSQTPMHLAIINKANERILLSFKNELEKGQQDMFIYSKIKQVMKILQLKKY